MSKQKVISFCGNTECPCCHIPMVLIDNNYKTIILDGDGNKTDDETCDYDLFIQCPQCKRIYDFVEQHGILNVYTKLQFKLDIYNTMSKIDKSIIQNNPFVKGD